MEDLFHVPEKSAEFYPSPNACARTHFVRLVCPYRYVDLAMWANQTTYYHQWRIATGNRRPSASREATQESQAGLAHANRVLWLEQLVTSMATESTTADSRGDNRHFAVRQLDTQRCW